MKKTIVAVLGAASLWGQQQPPQQKPGVLKDQHPTAHLIPNAEYAINGGPDWLAAGEDPSGAPMAWTNSRGTDIVIRMDPLTNRTIAEVPIGSPCSGLVVAMGDLWAPSCTDGVVHRISGTTNKTIATIAANPSNNEGGIAFGAGSVWLPIKPGDTLARIDPVTNTVSTTIPIKGGSHTAVFGYGRVWVSSTENDLVSVIHPATNKVIAEIPTDGAPRFMAVGEGYVWTLNQTNGSVSKIDPETMKVVATIEVGVPGGGGDIAAGEGSVWVTERTVPMTRIDPNTNEVISQFKGPGGDATRVFYGYVWLSNGRWGNVWRFHPTRADVGSDTWLSKAQEVDLNADGKADLMVEDKIVWHPGTPTTFHAKALTMDMGDSFVLKATLNGETTEVPMTAMGGVLTATYTGGEPRWIHYSVCAAGKSDMCSPDIVTASPTTTPEYAMKETLFVPDDFLAPGVPIVGDYVWHHLSTDILDQDYQFLVDAGRKPESIDIAEDYGELKRHEWEYRNASAFAYGVLTADMSKEVACVYVNPSKKEGYDAQVRVWISKPGADPDFDKELETSVREWISAKWPFKKVAYPGLDMSMDQWNSLPDLAE